MINGQYLQNPDENLKKVSSEIVQESKWTKNFKNNPLNNWYRCQSIPCLVLMSILTPLAYVYVGNWNFKATRDSQS